MTQRQHGQRLRFAALLGTLLLATTAALADQTISASSLTMTFGTAVGEISRTDSEGVRTLINRYETTYGLLKGGLGDAIEVKFPTALSRQAQYEGTDTELKLSMPTSLAGSSAWVGSVLINTFIGATATSPAKVEGSVSAWLGDQQVYIDNYIYDVSPTPVGLGNIRTTSLPIHQPFDRLEWRFAVHQALQDGNPSVTLKLPYLQFSPIWAAPVPEAGTGAMLSLGGLALAGLALQRRRQRTLTH